jgi:hypothetical protein
VQHAGWSPVGQASEQPRRRVGGGGRQTSGRRHRSAITRLINMHTGRDVSARSALSRWRDSTHGVRPPARQTPRVRAAGQTSRAHPCSGQRATDRDDAATLSSVSESRERDDSLRSARPLPAHASGGRARRPPPSGMTHINASRLVQASRRLASGRLAELAAWRVAVLCVRCLAGARLVKAAGRPGAWGLMGRGARLPGRANRTRVRVCRLVCCIIRAERSARVTWASEWAGLQAAPTRVAPKSVLIFGVCRPPRELLVVPAASRRARLGRPFGSARRGRGLAFLASGPSMRTGHSRRPFRAFLRDTRPSSGRQLRRACLRVAFGALRRGAIASGAGKKARCRRASSSLDERAPAELGRVVAAAQQV